MVLVKTACRLWHCRLIRLTLRAGLSLRGLVIRVRLDSLHDQPSPPSTGGMKGLEALAAASTLDAGTILLLA